MKKVITILKAWSILYWGVYFISTFYKWELYNPFWWVLELHHDQELRQTVLLMSFLLATFICILYTIFLDEEGKIKK